ncbi:MAG: hypothetical protein E7395_06565 [Ruminococcaceae bacterium]|nr:hypothetical protein [Oscillospiraceae bacterium]
MSKIMVLGCVCQECDMEFAVNDYLTNVVNLDYDSDKKSEFENMELNRVCCPHCKKSFTFEIPMVFVSSKLKYAIKVNPQSFTIESDTGSFPEFLIPDGFRLREVYFQVEALEKHRIFESLCDDKVVEYIKLLEFDNSDALPFDEVNLVFDNCDNNTYCFDKYNSTNDCLEKYNIDATNIKLPLFDESTFSGKWQRINRLTINDYIKKENGYE